MSLSLRRTGLSPPVYAKLADYTVIDAGREVGRIYEDPHASQPWFWSLTVFGAHLAGTKPSGRAATIEDAKAAIRRLTKRNRGVNLKRVLEELRTYTNGWVAYFWRARTPSVFAELDQWIRRRLRCYQWKLWKRPASSSRTQTSRAPAVAVHPSAHRLPAISSPALGHRRGGRGRLQRCLAPTEAIEQRREVGLTERDALDATEALGDVETLVEEVEAVLGVAARGGDPAEDAECQRRLAVAVIDRLRDRKGLARRFHGSEAQRTQ